MKRLKILAIISLVSGILAGIGQLCQFLALADIAHNEADNTLEWKITGISMMVTSFFILSTLVTLVYLLGYYLPGRSNTKL
ncbi:MAG: hypothetical protein U0X39_05235 [Bacteroidales bacterium]